MTKQTNRNLILVRGGGDIATGTIWTLRKAGFPVVILESERPSAIRRTVAFSEAVYAGTQTVEDMSCVLARSAGEAAELLEEGKLPVLVDPEGKAIQYFSAGGRSSESWNLTALVDAILAKRNCGTDKNMAPFVVALGPGFTAGKDCDAVIETMRGHNLGRIIREGSALPNTGMPGLIAGHASDRVLHAEADGILYNRAKIGDTVTEGQTIAEIRNADGSLHPVTATFTGLLRGLIRDGFPVTKGFKIADIDPRETEYRNCFTISDKARAIGGAVLLCLTEYLNGQE